MADLLNRATKQLLRSVNTPDYVPTWRKGDPAPTTGDWVVNPDLKAVEGVASKYWKLKGNDIAAMDAAEQAAVDKAEADAALAAEKLQSKAVLDDDRVAQAIIEALAPITGKDAATLLADVRAKIDAGA